MNKDLGEEWYLAAFLDSTLQAQRAKLQRNHEINVTKLSF